jgi:hypothetical protein
MRVVDVLVVERRLVVVLWKSLSAIVSKAKVISPTQPGLLPGRQAGIVAHEPRILAHRAHRLAGIVLAHRAHRLAGIVATPLPSSSAAVTVIHSSAILVQGQPRIFACLRPALVPLPGILAHLSGIWCSSASLIRLLLFVPLSRRQ